MAITADEGLSGQACLSRMLSGTFVACVLSADAKALRRRWLAARGQMLARALARFSGPCQILVMSTGMSLIRPSVRGKVRRSIRPSRPASKAAGSCYETGTFFAMFMAGMGTGKCPFSQDS